MKNNATGYGRMLVILIALASCATANARSEKDKTADVKTNPSTGKVQDTYTTEAYQLVQRLREDRLVNEVKGFFVHKKQNRIFIDGVQLPEATAQKYLHGLTQDELRAIMLSLPDRKRQHPEQSITELLVPFLFSSPLIVLKPGENGC